MTSTKGWTLEGIFEKSPNFHSVERVSATAPDLHQRIKKYEANGVPLVIEGFHNHPKWPQHMFTIDQFVGAYDGNDIKVRNIHNRTDSLLPLRDFIAKCRVVTPYRTKTETERYYGKDIECPKPWNEWLQNGDVVPKALINKGPEDVFRHLPNTVENAVETLMCYIGIGDTFTPCHKDSCASSGQNLMCYTERGGSSFWFMTESSSAQKAADYFQTLGHELDHECYFVKIDELSRAPFRVYVLEQKLGDMVLVPPRSCHQVINHRGVTFKTSWSRMTTRGLKSAFFHELPIYRRVCRPEIYQVKSTTYYSLLALTTELEGCLSLSVDSNDHVLDELKELLLLFEAILAEEYDEETAKQTPSDDGYRLTCDFCLAEIFQSYFECNGCNKPSEDPLHLCLGCYTEGRRCQCSVAMKPVQSRDFQVLRQASSNALRVIQTYEERFNRKTVDFSSELATIRKETPQLFRAGCILYRLLQIPISKREKLCDVCRNKAKSTHSTDVSNLMFCQQCHFATCYEHVLSDYKMHASEALLLSTPGTSKALYHATHTKAKSRFERDLKSASLDKASKKGDRPRGSQLYTMLTQNALKYTLCKPANHLLQPGWYDNVRASKPLVVTIPGRVSRRQSTEGPFTHAPTAPLSPSVPPSPTDSCADQASPPQSPIVVRSTKRKFDDVFVEVPSAPYDISRVKRYYLENAERRNPTQSTGSVDKSIAVTQAGIKQTCANPPRVNSPNKTPPIDAQEETRHKVRSSKPLNTDTPSTDEPVTSPLMKETPAGSSQVVDTVLPRLEQPKMRYPKFKKNLSAVSPTNRDSHAEGANLDPCPGSASPPHEGSPRIESAERIHPTDESGDNHIQQVPSMVMPTQETHIHLPSQSMEREIVSSVAAAIHTIIAHGPFFAQAARLGNIPAMAPNLDQPYYQQYSASSYPYHQDTVYQQQLQQSFTHTHPHCQEPLYQQQHSEASFYPSQPYYNDAPQWLTPSHYHYAGHPYSSPPSYIPSALYGYATQATSSHLAQSPHKSTRWDTQPRLERRRWERDPNSIPSPQNFPRRTTPNPMHPANYTRKGAYSRDGRKFFPPKGYSPKQHRRQSTHGSTAARMHRPQLVLRLERRSFPDFEDGQGQATHGTQQRTEISDDTLDLASAYDEDVEQAGQHFDSWTEVPIPVDSSLDRDMTPSSQETENRLRTVDTTKESDNTSEDDWEENYEKPDEVDNQVSSPPRFRMSSKDTSQDGPPGTYHDDHDHSSNPFNQVNPWNT